MSLAILIISAGCIAVHFTAKALRRLDEYECNNRNEDFSVKFSDPGAARRHNLSKKFYTVIQTVGGIMIIIGCLVLTVLTFTKP